jgi:hypothetical protein
MRNATGTSEERKKKEKEKEKKHKDFHFPLLHTIQPSFVIAEEMVHP